MSQPSDIDNSQPTRRVGKGLTSISFQSTNQQIFRALLSLASANLLVRIMGMLNQVVITARFGQGPTMDAYFVAQTLPILLAQLLSSALEASVIPVYAHVRAKEDKTQVSRLFSTLLNILLLGLVIFTIIMLCFRNQITLYSAPALKQHTLDLAAALTPFIFPVLLLMTVNSFMECLLNTEGQFGWPAYAGILVPITTTTCILLGGASFGVVMLCIGTLIGQVIQLIIVIIRTHQAHIRYQLVLDLRSKELASIAIVAWPALLGALISQSSSLIDQIFASSLTEGSIAAMNNALKLISVPVGVIFASIGRAVLPYLAGQIALKDIHSFKETLRLYLWAIGLITLGLSAGMILLAHPIVQILFQRGAFSVEDTTRTAMTLIGFAIGLTPMAIGFIASKAFSALGKTHILMYVTIFSIFANAIFDYIFGRLWQSFGIALATSMVYFCTMWLLLLMLRRMIGKLYLLTFPLELWSIIWKMGLSQHAPRWFLEKKGV